METDRRSDSVPGCPRHLGCHPKDGSFKSQGIQSPQKSGKTLAGVPKNLRTTTKYSASRAYMLIVVRG